MTASAGPESCVLGGGTRVPALPLSGGRRRDGRRDV